MAALYRLFLTSIATRGRLVAQVLLSLSTVLVGFGVGHNQFADHLDDGTRMIAALGLAVIAPVVSLVFASSVLGDPNEDGTLVYLWLRPVARWKIALSAALASLTVAMPIVLLPLTIAAAATKGGSDLVVGTATSCAVAVVAYTGVFTFLGLRVRRAIAWGLGYILIWEGFVANAGKTARLFSIRAHTTSMLARIDDGPAKLIHSSMPTALAVPLVAGVVAVVLTIRRLSSQDVA